MNEPIDRGTWFWVAVIVVLVALRGWGTTTTPNPPAPTAPPLIIMLHEADHGSLPPYALGAANELAAAGREVRPVDDDVLDGTGEVPDWLKPALEPGRALMGSGQVDDALVLLVGERVVKAIKLPATKAEILEAVR